MVEDSVEWVEIRTLRVVEAGVNMYKWKEFCRLVGALNSLCCDKMSDGKRREL